MRIALDTLGGENAPDAIIQGAIEASRRWEDLSLKLVGDPGTLKSLLHRYEGDPKRFSFQDGPSLISDTESPVEALISKPDASILVALGSCRRGEVDAVVSAGSTGAQIVASIQELGLLESVLRPAIGSYFPTPGGNTFILDVGANTSSRPIHLLQFAAMGTIFRQHLDGIEKPKVALLSNGEESRKGSNITRDAYELLEIVPELNFIGNIEGHDIYSDKADVIVCDGFMGNVLLKFAESIPEMLTHSYKSHKSGDKDYDPLINDLIPSFDYQEFGGVPLLGVNGVSIISHGHSTPKAITNAIGEAIKMVNLRVNEKIREQLTEMGQWSAIIKTKALLGRFRWRPSGDKQ
ncbi:phosphate acyltransferase PlsX [candidate division LCP-89 bacterium B3_LCP]|uniref:Phosphate acyltransferase n=1 Tax=candidate division LCP-89 bacterium B3_LCP TaxID=2012998 RepID=A0A532V5L3_UNCL8|nr:MAG: phosphate acyltransferase PlsX [candidate division LCP-89 bacterium B3_LCP]